MANCAKGLAYLIFFLGVLTFIGFAKDPNATTNKFLDSPHSESIYVGVVRGKSRVFGEGIQSAFIENSKSGDHSNAQVEFTFMKSDGSQLFRRFYIGNLREGDRWDTTFGWWIRGVDCVKTRFTSDQVTQVATLDIKNGVWSKFDASNDH